MSQIALLDPGHQISQEINTSAVRKHKKLIATVIKQRRFYQDVGDDKIIHFGRCREGVIMPNGHVVYCPSVRRTLLNLKFSGGWKRDTKLGLSEMTYTDKAYQGCCYKSLAATLKDIIKDYRENNVNELPKRLTPSCGGYDSRNQVFYSFFDGKHFHRFIKRSSNPQALLEKIHEQQQQFLVEYFEETILFLENKPDLLGERVVHCDVKMFK